PHPSPALSISFRMHPPPPTIYPLPLHDALPISDSIRQTASIVRSVAGSGNDAYCARCAPDCSRSRASASRTSCGTRPAKSSASRSEEHTSELQSLTNLVCRLLLEKKTLIHWLRH